MARAKKSLGDKYRFYQLGVQSPDVDVALLQQVYRQVRGRAATHFREDFCGTAATLCAWLEQGKRFTGEGWDIDPEPLAWGRKHNLKPLGKNRQQRANLCTGDAREPSLRAPDIRCAFNFSYWLFRERSVLLEYFRSVHDDLAADGVFMIDVQGGSEVFSEEEQITDCGEFELICHQTDVCPVDHSANLALHFRFPDGSEMRDAFRYIWRIWSMPELIDMLREAGFADVRCYWCADEEESEYEETQVGENDPAWIACLAALK